MVADNDTVLCRCRPHVYRKHRRHDSNRPLKAMRMKKFEYFLNAVHYCMWLREKRFGHFMEKLLCNVLFVFKSVSIRCLKKTNAGTQLINRSEMNKIFYSKKSFSIFWSNNWFVFFYCCYPGALSFLLAASAIKLFDDLNLIAILLFIAPVELTSLFVNRAVFKNDRYLTFFRDFEKEDDGWHKKWSRITTAFCLGAVVMTVAGIAAMWAVWLW